MPKRTSKREDILRSAMEAFSFYGYSGTTLNHIAAGAGVTRPCVIQFFGRKEDIAAICVERFLESFFHEISESADTPGITYREHIDNLFVMYQKAIGEWRFIFSALYTPGLGSIMYKVLETYGLHAKSIVARFSHEYGAENTALITRLMSGIILNYVLDGKAEMFQLCCDGVFERFID